MRILALIPARAGSKRLKNKNFKYFSGKPLIFWSIEAALKSEVVDKLIVSTDDANIKAFTETCGVHVKSLRPAHLATDDASAFDVAVHELEQNPGYTHLLYLQPTSPLRTAKDIANCVSFFLSKKAKSAVSVSSKVKKEEWCIMISEDGRITDASAEFKLKQKYCPNGALYLCEIDWFLKSQTFVNNETYAFVMHEDKSVDIDNLSDFVKAEKLHNLLLKANISEFH